MNPRRVMLTLAAILAASAAEAHGARSQLQVILFDIKAADVASLRSGCAMGLAPKYAADARAAGIDSPDGSAWCVTVLTRAGRDGTLGYVRDPRSSKPTPAGSFDSGFVSGYIKNGAVPASAPSMGTLMPIAERCLAQSEADLDLCSAAGQILGARAAHGEVAATP